jgi:hypothetical protein
VNRDDRGKMDMAISHFLETVENVHPEFLRKPKIHMLLHLPDDIFNFGPAIGFATERLHTDLINLGFVTKIFISDWIGLIKLFHSRIRHSDFDIRNKRNLLLFWLNIST